MSEDFGNEKSKSQIKREMLELKDLGKQLVELTAKSLDKIPLSESLREAVTKAKKMTRSALQRQLRYIGGLMPQEDSEAIRNALEELRRPHREEVRAFHETEHWRDRLIAGDEELLDELVSRHNADRQHLRQLLRNIDKERKENKPPKSARQLFQYLSRLKE